MATYDVVADLGADDTGGTAIDSAIESHSTYGNTVASGNTLIFPSGTYLLNDLDVPSGVNNFTLQGEPGANLVPQDHGTTNAPAWIYVAGDGFEMHQFSIRVFGRNPGPVDIEGNNWELTRLITRGETHADSDGDTGDSGLARSWFSLWVPSASGTGLIEDCYFQDGSNQSVAAGSNRRAILIDGGHGDITINRCWFEQWGENTIYAINPVGKVRILNSYWHNSQNGARTGGNAEVRNCVSIMDGPIPLNWGASALQRGVGYEAKGVDGTDYNQYNGTNEIRECDFYHHYRSPPGDPDSCGAAIGGNAAPEFAEIHDCRIYYNSDRSHDAIYNDEGPEGPVKRWGIDRVHVDNDCNGDQYCVDVGATPTNWGAVNGTWSAENGRFSNNGYVRARFETGAPDPPDTTPPLPEPGAGQPMGNATIVTVDNTGANQATSYSFDGAPTGSTPDSGTIHPSGVGGVEINMEWGETYPRRQTSASGELDPGGVHRYYIADGSLLEGSFSQSGNATLTVDGTTASTGPTANRWDGSSWQPIPDGAIKAGSSLAAEQLKYYDETAGEWVLVVDRN